MKASSSLAGLAHRIWRRKGLASAVLLPLSWLTGMAVARKKRRFARPGAQAQSRRPVVVVGNIYVGGTGKTPVVIALAQGLRARGWTPGVISRGYGSAAGGGPRVGRGPRLAPGEFGDEPALIAAETDAPIAVHRRRALALRALERAHPEVDVIIADDGLQHLALGRDIEIVVQDARGTGNGRLLPAGPLREPAAKLSQADYIVTNLEADQTDDGPARDDARRIGMRLRPREVRHLASQRTLAWDDWRTQYGRRPVDALAGIGQPGRFFRMLQACGLTLGQTVALPDHAAFEASTFDAFGSSPILITAKDAVKCAGSNDARLWAVHVAARFSDGRWLDDLALRLRAIVGKKTT